MANDGGNVVPRVAKAEHIGPTDTGDNIEAKRVAGYVWDSTTSTWQRMTQPGNTSAGATGAAVPTDATQIAGPNATGDLTAAQVANDTLSVPSLAVKSGVLDYRYSGGKTAYSTTLAASGDTTLITPATGNRIRVFWISFVPNSDNTAANLISLGFGTTSGSISTELYRGYAMAHWELFTGTANQSVIVNAGTAQPVALTIHYEEIT